MYVCNAATSLDEAEGRKEEKKRREIYGPRFVSGSVKQSVTTVTATRQKTSASGRASSSYVSPRKSWKKRPNGRCFGGYTESLMRGTHCTVREANGKSTQVRLIAHSCAAEDEKNSHLASAELATKQIWSRYLWPAKASGTRCIQKQHFGEQHSTLAFSQKCYATRDIGCS